MKCPSCTEDTRVLETRASGPTVRRKRECGECSLKFWSVEIPVGQVYELRLRIGAAGLELAKQGRPPEAP